jgi:hypothetical protein
MGESRNGDAKFGSRVLIVGTISNVSERLRTDFTSVRNAFSDYFEVFTYLVESDSSDETFAALNDLTISNKNFNFISFGDLRNSIPDRVERIRYCRNQYVKYIRDTFETHKWDYIVVADLDGMNGALSKGAVKSCFARLDWDCCLSNQTGGYYDIFALRESSWQPGNYFEEVEVARAKIGNFELRKPIFLDRFRLLLLEDSIKRNAIYAKMKRIPKGSSWVAVDSGFGGLAIYKPHIFLNFDYSKLYSQSRDSEHVDLHIRMREDGNKIFINPDFVNSHWNTYNVNRFFIIRQVRRLIWNNRTLYGLAKQIKAYLARY